MRQRIFSRGKGWYVSGTNHYDEKDKAYMNVSFPMRNGPTRYPEPGEDYSWVDIEIIKGKFESYKGKICLKVFEYDLVGTIDDAQNEQNGGQQTQLDPDDEEYGDEPW